MTIKCTYEGCDKDAVGGASGRRDWQTNKPGHPTGMYCTEHQLAVAGEDHPEYLVHCPACGCYFGVN